MAVLPDNFSLVSIAVNGIALSELQILLGLHDLSLEL